ncbi:MAG: exonuclease SbcCD subunit D [Acidimicrobiia bacterium]|nr:exonuclease SbcCD subunit D [Acidimicrobiia bacterium]
MKLLHTSDWHVGRTIRGRSRADEHRAVLSEIAGIAAAEAVDLVLVAGDLFDVSAPSAESERIVYEALLGLARVAPVLVVSGNHDHPRRLEAVSPLLELGRVTVLALPARADEGGVVRLPDLNTRVALLPFLSQRAIVTADDLMALDPDQHDGRYAGRLGAIIGRLTEDMTTDEVNILCSHLTVHGGEMGGGERTAHVFPYAIAAQSFPGSLSYVALGHLHRLQKVPAPAPVWYSGSPLQLDFGEVDDTKGVLVVEAEPGLPAAVREVRLETGRRLIRLNGTLEQVEALVGTTGDAYLKVELNEPARAGLADEVRRLFPEAVDVLLAAPAEHRAGPKVEARLGRSAAELFREYLQDRGVDDPRLPALFDLLLEETYET